MSKTPEDWLKEIEQSKRGRLKLYIGAAPGVGKTYKMLQDGWGLKIDGRDIVIGLIETHGRSETAFKIRNLEIVPLKNIVYKDRVFEEVNVEEILARNPEIVLIDELAHTNAPGSERAKRYMDVEVLLEAGIHVMSAVNIQHLESVHDIVRQISGISVRERLPDRFIQHADEIQLIDVTPETLQKRLIDGKIYASEKIEQSLNNFFTKTNLSALRELALREVADDVDERETHPVAVHEKILVCVQYGQTAEALIRRGFRMADRLKAELYILHVTAHDEKSFPDEVKAKVDEWKQLAAQFGAVFLLKNKGRSTPVSVISKTAKEMKVTQILLGQSARTRWEEIRKGSIVNFIMRETVNIDIHIVADKK